jgi:cyclophilin family peptidyl-prolyl cis-trans isomerase
MRYLFPIVLGLVLFLSACRNQRSELTLHTSLGDMVFILNQNAPRHRAYLEDLVEKRFFDSLLIHWVQQDYALAFGYPDSKGALPGEKIAPYQTKNLGFSPEGHDTATEGALVVRTQNDTSAMATFFVVQGDRHDEAALEAIARKTGRTIRSNRGAYLEYRSIPEWDERCTVIGRLKSGQDVLSRITALPRDANGRPLTDVRISKVTKWPQ